MLVIDDSDSVSETSWGQATAFATSLVNAFPKVIYLLCNFQLTNFKRLDLMMLELVL